jgi:hypothetical protein
VHDLKLVHVEKGDIRWLLDSKKVCDFLHWLEKGSFFLHYQTGSDLLVDS